METETYKNAKLILERFDRSRFKEKDCKFVFNTKQFKYWWKFVFHFNNSFCVKELESSPTGPMMSPKSGQGRTELR